MRGLWLAALEQGPGGAVTQHLLLFLPLVLSGRLIADNCTSGKRGVAGAKEALGAVQLMGND